MLLTPARNHVLLFEQAFLHLEERVALHMPGVLGFVFIALHTTRCVMCGVATFRVVLSGIIFVATLSYKAGVVLGIR